jgi:hypothetical protein
VLVREQVDPEVRQVAAQERRTYGLSRVHRGATDGPPTSEQGLCAPDREWLGSRRSATWRAAEVPAERADVLHAIYDRITIAGRKIVSVKLTPSAYAHGFALSLPEKVAV